jgi:hypothetical protein
MKNKALINYNLLSPYRLDRKKVKLLQAERELRNIDIARMKGIHPVPLAHNISGKGRNLAIQQAIADALGVSLESIAIPVAKTRVRKCAA